MTSLVRVTVWIALFVACGGDAPRLTAVGARDCGDGSLVRDPHDRFSFCTPYNAWVSTMHTDDEHEGPFDYTFYALRPGTSFSVTLHERTTPTPDFPKDARVDSDRASFHGREVEHQRARFHVHADRQDEMLENGRHEWHDAEDHDVTVERWVTGQGSGSIIVLTRVQEDTPPELRARLDQVVGSFRFGAVR